VDGVCVSAPVADAGAKDAGATDAGSTDAGLDAGTPDAGVDAGVPDGPDAGPPDAGGDAGAPDAGPSTAVTAIDGGWVISLPAGVTSFSQTPGDDGGIALMVAAGGDLFLVQAAAGGLQVDPVATSTQLFVVKVVQSPVIRSTLAALDATGALHLLTRQANRLLRDTPIATSFSPSEDLGFSSDGLWVSSAGTVRLLDSVSMSVHGAWVDAGTRLLPLELVGQPLRMVTFNGDTLSLLFSDGGISSRTSTADATPFVADLDTVNGKRLLAWNLPGAPGLQSFQPPTSAGSPFTVEAPVTFGDGGMPVGPAMVRAQLQSLTNACTLALVDGVHLVVATSTSAGPCRIFTPSTLLDFDGGVGTFQVGAWSGHLVVSSGVPAQALVLIP
jgi:hypothetical protein